MKQLLLLATAALLIAGAAAPTMADVEIDSESFILRTWALESGGPVGESPTCQSTSFRLRPRIAPPFVGQGESSSFLLWGGGAYTPVEASFIATAMAEDEVVLRWTVAELATVSGFHIERALAEEGPFERLTSEPLEPVSPGAYEDTDVWPGTAFFYRLVVLELDGSESVVPEEPIRVETGGVFETKLHAARPNPFRGSTWLVMDLSQDVDAARVRIYDVSGRLVKALVDGPMPAGRHELAWDGRSASGERAASGVYFCRFEAGDVRETSSMVLLR
ncbi:MAG: hypothetical protein GF405_04595 [Candidatus Eisenbacteria bacterium]|nr:hypothetical protein [Candidatus Eisenbacteria bacterium]